ncbi:MAG TPA: hypothetical protein VMQ50_07830 [Casimicrobiaceae bacterium]|nr:hypothetical protein [Casimicrobiaceae bacterium]
MGSVARFLAGALPPLRQTGREQAVLVANGNERGVSAHEARLVMAPLEGLLTNGTAARTCMRHIADILLLATALFYVLGAHPQDASTLRARETALREQLASNQFHQPLVVESTQTDGALKDDVYAVITQPYSFVGQALNGTDHWCDILMLHLNVKNCRPRGSGPEGRLSVAVGRKFDQPLELTSPVEFTYHVAVSDPDYLEVLLDADAGPLGTKNYHFVFEAVPLDANSSFVHMSYSYAYGMMARVAMHAYLATIGRDKVGFSVVGHGPDGTPVYVGSVRGVVERNTMRYYLAIKAYLNAYTLPATEQAETRLRDWFAAVERYPRQLHELERDEYLSMKRRELARQQAMAVKAN